MTCGAGRVLALDLGQVRIGRALSDALRLTAQPLDTFRRIGPRKDFDFLVKLIRDRSVDTVVVGLPLQLSGEEGAAALACRDFARMDFRLDDAGLAHFLEVNPLPSFAPDGSFGILAELSGRPLTELLAEVIAGGLTRLGLA